MAEENKKEELAPVVKKEVRHRQEKKMRDKFHDDFIKQDLKTALAAEWDEVIVPGIIDTGLDILSRVFRGKDSFGTAVKKSVKTRIGGSTIVDYNARYRTHLASDDSINSRTSMASRGSSYRIGAIYVSSRAEALEINEEMAARIEKYDVATVQDLFSLCGITRTNHQDNKWGWTSATSFRFRPSGDEWILDYDAPEYLGN